MRIQSTCGFLVYLGSLLTATTAVAQQSIDLNFGLSASKSLLGVSYTSGRNQLNIGLRGFAYSSRDGWHLQPGVSFNRYITENGLYAWLAYVPEYRSQDVEALVGYGSGSGFQYLVVEEKGWHPGYALAGVGKSWQFTRWGLHLDAGLTTYAGSDFGRGVGLYLGGAASYRFHLGD